MRGIRLILLVACSIAVIGSSAHAGHGATTLVSVALDGHSAHGGPTQGGSNGDGGVSISADGRFVAFSSDAQGIVQDDFNLATDIFVRDRVAGTTRRVSLGTGGVEANGPSYTPRISADGRYVAFYSLATNIVPGSSYSTYVADLSTGRIENMAIGPHGEAAGAAASEPAISADGRFVAFMSDETPYWGTGGFGNQLFVRDRKRRTTTLVSRNMQGFGGRGYSFAPSISADGRFIAFESWADDLVPGDTNFVQQPVSGSDVFVFDRKTGSMRRVSVSTGGVQGNGPSRVASISGNGRFVSFQSDADNLISGDTNGAGDLFVHDLSSHTTSRTIVGASAPAVFSFNGATMAFHTTADLIPADTNATSDVYTYSFVSGALSLVSLSASGWQGNGWSGFPAVGSDARFVAFVSEASNLAPGDDNQAPDVFVRDRAYAGGDDGGTPPADDAAPVTSATMAASESSGMWTRGSWSVTLACSDDVSGCAGTTYGVNGVPAATYTQPLVFDVEGRYAIAFASVDFAGNVEAARTVTVGVDRSTPSAEMVAPTAPVFVSSATLQARASDAVLGDGSTGSGVAKVCFVAYPMQALSGTTATCDAQQSGDVWTEEMQLLPGLYEVATQAFDAAGNGSVESARVQIVVI